MRIEKATEMKDAAMLIIVSKARTTDKVI